MIPIHEMKTRKATWGTEDDHVMGKDWGVFFEVNGREVGVVIRGQPEEVAKPLIEAIAALPMVASVLRQVAVCKADRCAQCKRQLINLAEMLGGVAMSHSGKEGGSTSKCTKCGDVVPSSKRRSHYRLKHPLPSDLRSGQPETYTCGCGAVVNKYAKNAHRLSCPNVPNYVAPEPTYTKTKRLCDYEECGTEYTPKAPSQRYCKPACKVADAKPLDEEAREQAYLSPIKRAEDDLSRRCREAGEALMGRERSYELWAECLGVNLEAA